MSEPAPVPSDPPMVLRVEPSPAPSRPKPGLLEAVFWCVVFLFGQLAGAALVTLAVLGVYALQAESAAQFIDDQTGGLTKAAAYKGPANERPVVPREIGLALAWGMFGAQVVSLGVIALVLPRRIGPDWKRQIGLRRPPIDHVFLVVIMLPAFIIYSSALAYLLELAGAKPLPGSEALKSVFAAWPAWLTVLTVGVGPGVVEELWCRGFLGRGLCARYGLTIGIVLTSVLFALLHLQPVYAVVYAAMGAFLHFTYLASRSLWVPIILHALNNGLGTVMALKGILLKLEAKPDTYGPVMYLSAGALLLFGSIAMWTGRVELRGPKLKEPTFQPEYPGVSAPPPGSEDTLGRAEASPAAFTIALIAFGVLLYLLTR